jgi:hypothetical protein
VAEERAQIVEHLASIQKALDSIPITTINQIHQSINKKEEQKSDIKKG